MTDEQIKQEALVEKPCKEKAEKNNTIDLNAYAIGLQDMFNCLQYQHNPTVEKLKELRTEIEDISQRLDLIEDSELIQCYGSITGRLTQIIGDY